MQAVAGLRVKLQPNTILSMVTLPASLCLFSPLSFCSALFFFLPSLYSSWQQLTDLKNGPDPK